MPDIPTLPRNVRFDPFELDTVTAELRKHGIRIRLQEQPFRILLALLEASGDVVTREELVHRLWPDQTFVDFDRGLNAAINRLRQVLGDSAESRRYVETVARRGYRFTASWEAVQTERQATAATAQPHMRKETRPDHPRAEARRDHKSRRATLALALLTTAIASGAVFLLLERSNPVARTGEAQPGVSPLTTYPGAEVDPSLSPDASQVVFAWNGEERDVFHIYVQAVGATSARRLTADPAEEVSPVWSPDGRWVAFLRRVEPGRAAIVVVSASGGAERRLTTINSSPPEGWFGALLDWHPGGDWIAASELGSDAAAQGLVLISTRNGSMHRITNPAQRVADLGPAFRPDGRYLSFVRLITFGPGTLYGLSLGQNMRPVGEPVLLHAPADSVAASPAWSPDGSEVFFLSGPSFVPELRITRLQPESGKFKTVPFTTARQISAVRRSAKHEAGVFAFARETVDENIWRFRHRPGGGSGTQFQATVESTWGDNDAHFSPDGKRIVFRSARSGSWEIWASDSNGSNPVKLTDFRGAQVGAARWSPDGRLIALHARPGGQGDVYVVSPDGGLPQRMTKDPAQDTGATWSNDSRQIYFTSDRGGRSRLLRMRVGDENPTEITESGGFAATESPDGKWLYFIRRDPAPPTLVRKPLARAGHEEVVTSLLNGRAFELVEDGLYFIPPPRQGEPAVVQFLGNDGRTTEVARLPKPATYGLSVFPRTRAPERIILYTQKDRVESDLFVAEGNQ